MSQLTFIDSVKEFAGTLKEDYGRLSYDGKKFMGAMLLGVVLGSSSGFYRSAYRADDIIRESALERELRRRGSDVVALQRELATIRTTPAYPEHRREADNAEYVAAVLMLGCMGSLAYAASKFPALLLPPEQKNDPRTKRKTSKTCKTGEC